MSFEDSNLELPNPPRDVREVEIPFPFKNAGKAAIEILSIKSSCDCTTVALEKKVYQPGESGVVRANFAFGERVGEQFKQITVKTDEGNSYRLSFHLTIPERIMVRPVAVFWQQGEKSEPKEIEVNVHNRGG